MTHHLSTGDAESGTAAGTRAATRSLPGALPRRTPGATPPPAVLVTGASSGIGAAVARRLAAAGACELLLNGRDAERLSAVAAATGGVAMPGDLTTSAGARELAERAERRFGRLDVLVASAGVGWCGPFAQMPPDAVERLIAVNLAAPLHMVRALLPGMLRRNAGHVVLVASIAGAVGVGEEAVYSATKAALCSFADGLRYELRDTGVRVSVLVPGAVDTPFFARRGAPYTRRHPRTVPPERVAEQVHRALLRPRDEVFVPGWLRFPARLHGAAPVVFRRLAERFG
ncbi:SDR family NAD(P)-dependent oxidoreductase [Streptomyces sp. ICBB 8177]|uniref:SDR family NAD(P)-dependent oxidoreductase n=1 Tax=Streptomyces sp. ICBB 8177 TaxID=563922 RepID=UPI000D68429F|nr:SDR family NAD(P)-dependent oxidoreductase [Streptomyces sp. ICBB 8177]PWI40933.1 short-chain dehydrogenase [Streptomyces sp. ICBB 8177]